MDKETFKKDDDKDRHGANRDTRPKCPAEEETEEKSDQSNTNISVDQAPNTRATNTCATNTRAPNTRAPNTRAPNTRATNTRAPNTLVPATGPGFSGNLLDGGAGLSGGQTGHATSADLGPNPLITAGPGFPGNLLDGAVLLSAGPSGHTPSRRSDRKQRRPDLPRYVAKGRDQQGRDQRDRDQRDRDQRDRDQRGRDYQSEEERRAVRDLQAVMEMQRQLAVAEATLDRLLSDDDTEPIGGVGRGRGRGMRQDQTQDQARPGQDPTQHRGLGIQQAQHRGLGIQQAQPRGMGIQQAQPSGLGIQQDQPRGMGIQQAQPRGLGIQQAQHPVLDIQQDQPRGTDEDQARRCMPSDVLVQGHAIPSDTQTTLQAPVQQVAGSNPNGARATSPVSIQWGRRIDKDSDQVWRTESCPLSDLLVKEALEQELQPARKRRGGFPTRRPQEEECPDPSMDPRQPEFWSGLHSSSDVAPGPGGLLHGTDSNNSSLTSIGQDASGRSSPTLGFFPSLGPMLDLEGKQPRRSSGLTDVTADPQATQVPMSNLDMPAQDQAGAFVHLAAEVAEMGGIQMDMEHIHSMVVSQRSSLDNRSDIMMHGQELISDNGENVSCVSCKDEKSITAEEVQQDEIGIQEQENFENIQLVGMAEALAGWAITSACDILEAQDLVAQEEQRQAARLAARLAADGQKGRGGASAREEEAADAGAGLSSKDKDGNKANSMAKMEAAAATEEVPAATQDVQMIIHSNTRPDIPRRMEGSRRVATAPETKAQEKDKGQEDKGQKGKGQEEKDQKDKAQDKVQKKGKVQKAQQKDKGQQKDKPDDPDTVRVRPKPKVTRAESVQDSRNNNNNSHVEANSADPGESWESIFDENGDYLLSEDDMQEVMAVVGEVKVKPSQMTFYQLQQQVSVAETDEHSHLLELYNFPETFQTADLVTIFKDMANTSFDIKWVDETHAIAVFNNPQAASTALTVTHPLVKMRPLTCASEATKAKVKKIPDLTLPHKPRPQTIPFVARNMVTNALGIKSNITKEQRDEEKRKLSEARAKKRAGRSNKEKAWDGTLKGCAMDEM